ncbi:hypothetical protein NK6_4116 [Bradyrhizobium diazoefficiens]|uniref:Uncharacterized protein n=1 Tax=Bradyrhizobium diazoefficiens TaxID=1355477 RepID=A0A0E3VUE8_9BRAD|nr:hypothetical protein NK6_4116 [Bradyrhizobium diazoefficiens]
MKTVSKYRKEKTRVPDKIKGKQANLGAALARSIHESTVVLDV